MIRQYLIQGYLGCVTLVPRQKPPHIFNFFNDPKHANYPIDHDFDYNENQAIVMLFRALVNYQLVTGELTEPMEKALDVLRKDHPGLFPSLT